MDQGQAAAEHVDDRIVDVSARGVAADVVELFKGKPDARIGVVCEGDPQRRALSKAIVDALVVTFAAPVEGIRCHIYSYGHGHPRGMEPRVRFFVLSEAPTGGKLDVVIRATSKAGDPRWWRDLGHRLARRPSNGEG